MPRRNADSALSPPPLHSCRAASPLPGPWASPRRCGKRRRSPRARSAAPAAAATHQSAASRSGPSGAAYAPPHRAERPPFGEARAEAQPEAGGSQRSCAGTESSAAQAARAQLAQLTAERAMLALHNPPDLPQPAESAADSFSEPRISRRSCRPARPASRRAGCHPLLPSHTLSRPAPSPSLPTSPRPLRLSPAAPILRAAHAAGPTTPGVRRATKLRVATGLFPSNGRQSGARADQVRARRTREFLSSRKRSSNSIYIFDVPDNWTTRRGASSMTH